MLEHEPGDLTAIVEAGIKLSDLQAYLGEHGQMLALDPPGDPTVGACLAADLSGPRRHRYGAMRDLVIGVTIVLPGGMVASSGGKVVKNVAGYDLGKLFSGSRGRLGLIARVALRLHPRPAAQATVVAETDDPRALWAEIHRSQLEPSAVDFLPAGPDRVPVRGAEGGSRRSGGRLPGRHGRRRGLGRERRSTAGRRQPGPVRLAGVPPRAARPADRLRRWSERARMVTARRAGARIVRPGRDAGLMDMSLIDDCVHCGFCLPTCPTYELWHEEMDSPRGRIWLMRATLDGTLELNQTVAEHFDRCLGCMACLTSCPSGVQYDRLIELARERVEQEVPRPVGDRLLRSLVFAVFPKPKRLQAGAQVQLAARARARSSRSRSSRPAGARRSRRPRRPRRSGSRSRGSAC